MPPRDKALDEIATGNNGSFEKQNNGKESSTSSATMMEKLILESQEKAKMHNIPVHGVGFFKNTFHYELNILTFGFWFLVYFAANNNEFVQNVFHIMAILVLADATRYYYKKGNIPGAPYTLPFVSLVAMIIFPVRFWAELAYIATESNDLGMCTTLLGGNFMIFITDTKLCRQVMTGEGTFQIYAHPNALWLFGSKNLIYMNTEPHKAFRAILTPALFSKEALVSYAEKQEMVCRKYLHKYSEDCKKTGKPIDARIAFRSMAAASSQEAFLGPYLKDQNVRDHLEYDIVTFTMGFLSFPIPWIGGLRQAIMAKNRIEATIEAIVPQAHAYVKAGNEPRCLMDRWCLSIQNEAMKKNVDVEDVPFCSHDNMARTVLDFLFAAQDATNSALAYALDVLDEDKYVFNKIRKELDEVCGSGPPGSNDNNDQDHNNTAGEIWTKMKDTSETIPYTAKAANQLLHHKPPVPMIPHLVKKPTTLAGRHIGKGTVVIPSITYSARTSGASIEFQPERVENADPLFVSTVTFGAGQHKCPGRRYAESLLTVFLCVLAQEFDFYRYNANRPKADEFVYFPTLFPKDCDFIIQTRGSSEQANE